MFALDLFCGAGGLTRGFEDAGIKVLGGIDIDPTCRESYTANNPRSKFLAEDIRKIDVERTRELLSGCPLDRTVLVGCAPCQPFSKHQKGGREQAKATLLSHFSRIVRDLRPAAVVAENVPGMARVKGFSTFRRFIRCLQDAGYSVATGVLDAKSFGVPQSRRRLVLIASRSFKASLPSPAFGSGHQPYTTVRSAIEHFPELAAGESCLEVPNHVSASLSDLNIRRIRATPPDGGGRRDWPKHLRLSCHSGGHEGHTDVYGRMRWDEPAPTLTSRCNSLSNGRYGHPLQNRAISLREAAALQTFPDNYVFHGSDKSIAAQIGNAVPVNLAYSIARHLRLLAEWGSWRN